MHAWTSCECRRRFLVTISSSHSQFLKHGYGTNLAKMLEFFISLSVPIRRQREMNGRQLMSLIIGACVGASPTFADSFRCGNYFAREGMNISDITKICGEPSSKEVKEEIVYSRTKNGVSHAVGTEVTEYWTFDRGWGQFPAMITVKDGVATEIKLRSRTTLERE